MFVTNWISTTKIQKISEITNFFRHYFLSRTEVILLFLFPKRILLLFPEYVFYFLIAVSVLSTSLSIFAVLLRLALSICCSDCGLMDVK